MPRKKKGSNIGRRTTAAKQSAARRQQNRLEDIAEETERGDDLTEAQPQTTPQEEVNEERNGETTVSDAAHPQNDRNPQQIVVEEATGYRANGATDREDELQQQQHRANKRSTIEEEEEETGNKWQLTEKANVSNNSVAAKGDELNNLSQLKTKTMK